MSTGTSSSTSRSLVRATTLVSGAMVVSRILGFLRNSIIAAMFGQTRLVDAFNAAYQIPDTLYLILIGGGVSSAFVPVVSRYLAQGNEEEAWRVTSIAFNVVLIGISLVILLGEITAPWYVHLLVPGFSVRDYWLTVDLTRIAIVTILFHALNGVLIGTEYAYSAFLGTSIGPLCYNGAIILGGLWLGPKWGIGAFVWATLFGAFLNFVVQLLGVRSLGARYHPRLDLRHPGIRRIGQLVLPVMLGFSIAQLNLLLNQSFLASYLPHGTINALTISSRIMLMPVLVATSMGITLLPSLTRQATVHDDRNFRASLSTAIRGVLFLSVPASVGLMVLAHPLVTILFRHGRFTAHASQVTSGALVYYSIGIAAYGLYEILSRAFYALGDTRTPVKTGLLSLAVGVALNFLLVGPMGYRGLALAYSLSGFVNAILLLVLLRRRMGHLEERRVARTFLLSLAASGGMAVIVWGTVHVVGPVSFGPRLVREALDALLPVAVGAVSFFGLAWLLRMEELQSVAARLRRRLQHKAAAS